MTARPIAGLNQILSYGQSLSDGWEGCPALSLVPRTAAMMLGRSVRARQEWSPRWEPVSDADPHPLIATNQDIQSGALLSPTEAALMPMALGETVLEAAVHTLQAALASEQILLASACGVGGRSMEALSRGADPDLFNRLRDCVRLGQQAAVARGWDHRLLAVLLLQGENNSWAMQGATADAAGYQALLRRWHADVAALSPRGPPAVFAYQTGGAYASGSLSIAQAQLDTALSTPGWFMAAPSYPVTDKGGHLDANGYRWLGAQFGKVMREVLVDRVDWRPLHPLGAVRHARWIAVSFHAPVPPLRWGLPYDGYRPNSVPARGFSARDGAGELEITAIELTGPVSVLLTLARTPGPDCVLRYAAAGPARGLGCLHDSDLRVADEIYEPGANGTAQELVGRHYPLMNWCAAFSIPVPPAGDPDPLTGAKPA